MPQKDRITLKSYFETGDKPTQSQFANLIDSMALINEAGNTISLTAGTMLTSGHVGRLIVNKAGKAELLNIKDRHAGQKGKWTLVVQSLPTQPTERIIEIDFSSVLNTDFISGSTHIIISPWNYTMYYNSSASSTEIQIGSNISDTIDNTVNFFTTHISQFSVTRVGSVITINTCPPTNGNYNMDIISFNYYEMSAPPIITIVQERNEGSISYYSDFMNYSGQAIYARNLLTDSYYYDIGDGSFEHKWEFYFPLNSDSFAKQLSHYLSSFLDSEYVGGGTVEIEEYQISEHFNTLSVYNFLNVSETTQSLPFIFGEIDGVLLSELMKVENGTAFINASEIVGVISQTDIEAGKLITVANNGFVVTAVPDDVSMHQHIPYYIALTSGKQIKARLINPNFYLYNITGTSSSSSGNSSGG